LGRFDFEPYFIRIFELLYYTFFSATFLHIRGACCGQLWGAIGCSTIIYNIYLYIGVVGVVIGRIALEHKAQKKLQHLKMMV